MMKGRLIAFRVFKRLGQRRTNQFCKQFYGQDTTTQGKKYRRRGVLDRIPHRKLIRGVLVVSTKNADEIVKFLRKFNAEVHVREVSLTPEDKKMLRVKG
ncbi:MAG: hypothetical protein U9M97_00170 [Candidatus Hadarchaeota archaeon]|nr:hypothetical protein [Candidatus Hadarchaeota archaeon]